jgi:hypothetical protein
MLGTVVDARMSGEDEVIGVVGPCAYALALKRVLEERMEVHALVTVGCWRSHSRGVGSDHADDRSEGGAHQSRCLTSWMSVL